MVGKMFYTTIPEEIALRLFSHIGLTSLHDSRWFRKKDIQLSLSKLTEDIFILEPYYVKKYKFYITRDLNASRIACIFRQVAKCFGLVLIATERSRYGEKQTYYRFVNPILQCKQSFVVEFD